MTPTMTRRARLLILPGVCGLCLSASAALADAPGSLAHATPDAPLIVTVRNVGQLVDNAGALIGELGLPGEIAMGPALVNGLLMTPGLDRAGSLTAVLYPPDDEHFEMRGGIIIPVTDYGAFTEAVGAAQDDGVASFDINGSPAFARDLGRGYALIGPEAEWIRDYAPGADLMQRHADRMGGVGMRVADSADITLIAGPSVLEMVLREGAGLAEAGAMDQAANFGMGDMVGEMGQAAQEAIETFLASAQVGVIGLTLDDFGVALDFGAQFKNGSELDQYFHHNGRSAELAEHLPATGYWLAGAMDTDAPGMKDLAALVQENLNGVAPMADDSMTGAAIVLGANPALFQTGLMAKTAAYFRTDDPGSVTQSFRNAMEAMNGENIGGMSYTSTFEADATEVNGVSASAFTVSSTFDPDQQEDGDDFNPMAMMMDPQTINQALYGPNASGPTGYMAATDGGVVTTLSRSEAFLASAVTAANGGVNLTGDTRLAASRSRLPNGRAMELYISLDRMAQTAVPMLMMTGVLPEAPEIPDMPPIALGLTANEGGAHARLLVPRGAMRFVSQLVAPMLQGGGGDWDGN